MPAAPCPCWPCSSPLHLAPQSTATLAGDGAPRAGSNRAAAARAFALVQSIAEGSNDAIFAKDLRRYLLAPVAAASRFIGPAGREVLGRDDRAWFRPSTSRLAEVMRNDAQVMA